MERTLSRRGLLVIAGGAALPVLPGAAASDRPTIAALIAEYQRCADAYCGLLEAADLAWYAAVPDEELRRMQPTKPPAIQRLYDKAARRHPAFVAAYERVVSTPCATLHDVIAKMEWWEGDLDDLVEAVLPDLRRLAA